MRRKGPVLASIAVLLLTSGTANAGGKEILIERTLNSAIGSDQNGCASLNQTDVGQVWTSEGNDELDSVVALASDAIRHSNKG